MRYFQIHGRVPLYLLGLLTLNLLLATQPWGSVYLSLIIALTYFMFLPQRVLHPNNMVFAFYGLYVILSSTLNLILDFIDWEYVLPWGQQVNWESISKYVLFQGEFTFLVLFFSFHTFAVDKSPYGIGTGYHLLVRPYILKALYVATLLLIVWFIQSTAGWEAWITDYSATYLIKREGHGLLNVVIIALGNVVVFLLGLKAYYANNKTGIVLAALFVIAALSFANGVKSRFIFLLIMFLVPLFMEMRFRVRHLFAFAFSFIVLLYLGSLVRTEGFYAKWPFFVEMLIGYFNAFQLHDYVVTSREPALFETVFQVFIKPMQILGAVDPNEDYDISIMLTKEFFPEHWYRDHATQQWPLDTELYLNYYGPLLAWIPLIAYAGVVSLLYRYAIVQRNYLLVPIFVMEFQRIFSTLRGTLIPWETPIYVLQYVFIYFICRACIQIRPNNVT